MKRLFFIIALATSMCVASTDTDKPSWLYNKYIKTASLFNRAKQCTGSLLATLATYFLPVARKRTLEQRIKAFETAMVTLYKADSDADAYFQKIDDLARTAAQKASPSKLVKAIAPPAEEVIEANNADHDNSGSCVFNYAGPRDLPTEALQQSPSKQAHRKLSTRDSLRNILTEIKKKHPQELLSSTHLLPARIQAALDYLGHCAQENINLHQQIMNSERIHTITIPYEGIDIQTGQLVTDPIKLLEEYECPAYSKPMMRAIDYKDISLICGLTKKGKKYNNAEDYLNNNPDVTGHSLYRLAQLSDDDLLQQGLNHENVRAAWADYLKNFQFFDRKKAQAYFDQDQHSELLNEYIVQQQKFMEENQNFRKGFIDEAETLHTGWIDILAEEKQALEKHQQQSAKRWYLW